MTSVLYRNSQHKYAVAAGACGVEFIDADGKRYIDGSCGAAVSCLGHGHPDVLDAIQKQLYAIPYAHTAFFTTEAAEELADDLVTHAPEGISKCYFVSGGSEAMESALKLARQYFVEIGQPGRRHFIARRQSYHGNTLGALSVGDNVARRQKFEPLLFHTTHVSPCFSYRGKAPGETSPSYVQRLGKELEDEIQRSDPSSVIAFVAETVVGATAGAVEAEPGYFKLMKTICDRYGILMILDEVMCGMGRTGTLHACEQEGVSPDIIAIAKGLGAGYVPIGAILINQRIIETIEQGTRSFTHGHTYSGHALACVGALAVQRVIRRDGLLENVRLQGQYLKSALSRRFRDNPFVGDVRGRGLFCAVELVENKASRRPFDPALKLHAKVKTETMNRGLLVYPMGGTIDGIRGDHVLIAPPFISNGVIIDEIVSRLGDALDAALAAVELPSTPGE